MYFFLYSIVEADKFTGNLFKIYETVHKEGITQVRNCLIIAVFTHNRFTDIGIDCIQK